MADLESDAGGGEAPKARASRCEAPRSSVSPSPPGEGSGEGARPPPQKFFLISELKWCVLVHFSRKNSDTIGLEKLTLFSLCVVVVK